MRRELTEVDVELLERYAAALEKIEAAEEITEREVELAERYASALEHVEAGTPN